MGLSAGARGLRRQEGPRGGGTRAKASGRRKGLPEESGGRAAGTQEPESGMGAGGAGHSQVAAAGRRAAQALQAQGRLVAGVTLTHVADTAAAPVALKAVGVQAAPGGPVTLARGALEARVAGALAAGTGAPLCRTAAETRPCPSGPHPSIRPPVCPYLPSPRRLHGAHWVLPSTPPAHPGPPRPGSAPPPFPPPILGPAYLALPGSTRPSVRVPAPPHPSSPSPLLTLAPADQAIIALAVDVVTLAEAPEDTLVGDVALVAHALPAQAVPQPRADEGVVVPPAAALQLLTAPALRLAFTVLPDVAGVAPAAGGALGQAPFSQSCGPGPHLPHTCPHHFTCRCRTPWSPCHHRGRGSGSCPCNGTRTAEGRERSPCP